MVSKRTSLRHGRPAKLAGFSGDIVAFSLCMPEGLFGAAEELEKERQQASDDSRDPEVAADPNCDAST